MPTWLIYSFYAVFFWLTATAFFFFTFTRGALILRGIFGGAHSNTVHVYPIYSNMRLIRLIDFQPIISAILLFQYDRLVSMITTSLLRMNLVGNDVLITSCAFGNVIPKIVEACERAKVRKILIVDIIKNELEHAKRKLGRSDDKVEFMEQNATKVTLADGSVSANVIFFLLHELPHHLKGEALRESVRVLAPGGTLFLAEFHRPSPWLLCALSWTYFKVFEPLGLALWDTHDPLKLLEEIGGRTCERRMVFFGNFQIITATKN